MYPLKGRPLGRLDLNPQRRPGLAQGRPYFCRPNGGGEAYELERLVSGRAEANGKTLHAVNAQRLAGRVRRAQNHRHQTDLGYWNNCKQRQELRRPPYRAHLGRDPRLGWSDGDR